MCAMREVGPEQPRRQAQILTSGRQLVNRKIPVHPLWIEQSGPTYPVCIDGIRLPMRFLRRVERHLSRPIRRKPPVLCGRLPGLLQTQRPANRVRHFRPGIFHYGRTRVMLRPLDLVRILVGANVDDRAISIIVAVDDARRAGEILRRQVRSRVVTRVDGRRSYLQTEVRLASE